jgi:hypothetical protein
MASDLWRSQSVTLTTDRGWVASPSSEVNARALDWTPPTFALVADKERALLLCCSSSPSSGGEGEDDGAWRVFVHAPHALLLSPATEYELHWRTGELSAPVDRLLQLSALEPAAAAVTAQNWSEHEMVTALSLPRRMTKSYTFMRRYIFKDASRMRQATRAEQDAFRASYRPQASLAADFESDDWWLRKDPTERVPVERSQASELRDARSGRPARPRFSEPDRRRNDARISNARAKLSQQRKTRRAASSDSEDDSDESSSESDDATA